MRISFLCLLCAALAAAPAAPALAQVAPPPAAPAAAGELPALPLPPDTSFTVHSALAKVKKQFPGSTIARPAVPAGVRVALSQPYCTRGAHTLLADVCRPAKKRRGGYPAVVFVHGGGWGSGHRQQHLPMAQQLAGRGYVCVLPEYRLATEARYPAAVLDVKAAIRWARAHAKTYNIDTSRVAVWGFSAGGQLAALVATTPGLPALTEAAAPGAPTTRVQALVDVDGTLAFTHPESGEGDDSKRLSAATLWLGAPRTAQPALWQQAGALSHVGAGAPPTLFLNSSVARMHAGRDDFMRQLTAFGIYHEVHTFADAPHVFPLLTPWFQPTLDYTAAFLARVFH
ncbi:MAG TPA: alpha/beta hydrolase [Hymenobacter sp.]|uniref:alpha/beta hydrolase n=1 Tax=Hymenobacter sp. TaxID=1898978 RepID=UPI002D7E9634|nr:alpha/beta hydrolase [Hymenobacter sp.]HET9502287.1 alpha/beta hydrolase [Hymenobacter sp.]